MSFPLTCCHSLLASTRYKGKLLRIMILYLTTIWGLVWYIFWILLKFLIWIKILHFPSAIVGHPFSVSFPRLCSASLSRKADGRTQSVVGSISGGKNIIELNFDSQCFQGTNVTYFHFF